MSTDGPDEEAVRAAEARAAHAPASPQERFRAWIVPELGLLHAMAMRLTRDPQAAEDLVQDTMVRIWRAIDRFDGRYPRAWSLTILRNTHINRLRKRTPDLAFDPDQTFGRLAADDGRDTVSEDALARIADPALTDALAGLSDAHRAVVALVDVDGLSYQEAADMLGVPIGTVMSRLHRARRKVREALESAGSAGEGAA